MEYKRNRIWRFLILQILVLVGRKVVEIRNKQVEGQCSIDSSYYGSFQKEVIVLEEICKKEFYERSKIEVESLREKQDQMKKKKRYWRVFVFCMVFEYMFVIGFWYIVKVLEGFRRFCKVYSYQIFYLSRKLVWLSLVSGVGVLVLNVCDLKLF